MVHFGSKDDQKIVLKKLYGDFKRLNSFILSTFQNEIKEYEQMEEITSMGAIKNGK